MQPALAGKDCSYGITLKEHYGTPPEGSETGKDVSDSARNTMPTGGNGETSDFNRQCRE